MTSLASASQILGNEPWTPTPFLPALILGNRLGLELWLKREDCTPVGSFKLRGALVAMERLRDQIPDAGIWVASAGNFGLAVAVAGARHGVRVTVVVPKGATPSKVERIRLAGADVTEYGDDFDEAKDFARSGASRAVAAFWEDGAVPELATGAATMAAEMLDQSGSWDCVLVPVGNGSLIKGVASVFKDRSPDTHVVGLVASGAPAMHQAMTGGAWNERANISTLADGLAVRVPITGIVKELEPS
ncbi:MAG: pyridoxal-phosphate dependent enzyme [Chloroflexi bacterium]|nr:pyridoxal-phosphate dependent enzyme [Chloroflexota bacterium]